jgi:hypothetical protein
MSGVDTARRVVRPSETRTFLVVAGWAVLLGVIYWFVTYELAGTLLLIGLGAAAAVVAGRLVLSTWSSAPPAAPRGDGATARRDDEAAVDAGAGGQDDARDRPFLDEVRRLPSPSLSPVLIGLGLAVAATSLVFGLAPLAVGMLPILVGARGWLRSAGDELEATIEDEAHGARDDVTHDGAVAGDVAARRAVDAGRAGHEASPPT